MEKNTKHACERDVQAGMPHAATTAGIRRQTKRETAMVSIQCLDATCTLIALVALMTSPPCATLHYCATGGSRHHRSLLTRHVHRHAHTLKRLLAVQCSLYMEFLGEITNAYFTENVKCNFPAPDMYTH